MGMAQVLDVADYILKQRGPLTAMKLQKLVYYSQAWSLVWDEKPLFDDEIQAWANGPVCPTLYSHHRGAFNLPAGAIPGDADKLGDNERDTIDRVLAFYGDRNSQWLSDLTHMERPWMDARSGRAAGERGFETITHEAMAEYYGSLS